MQSDPHSNDGYRDIDLSEIKSGDSPKIAGCLYEIRSQRILGVDPQLCDWLGQSAKGFFRNVAELLASLGINTDCFDPSNPNGSEFVSVATHDHAFRITAIPLKRSDQLKETDQAFLAFQLEPTNEYDSEPIDTLTDLPLRISLAKQFEAWCQQKEALRRPSALLFIDLNDFKQVNDRWGHVVGDQVLRIVAQRIAATIREHDLLVRYGGDEFVVMLSELTETSNVDAIIERIRQSVSAPALVDKLAVKVSASIGLAIAYDPSRSLEDLIQEADRAMYEDKKLSVIQPRHELR